VPIIFPEKSFYFADCGLFSAIFFFMHPKPQTLTPISHKVGAIKSVPKFSTFEPGKF
jgi:hypothetical protein